MKMTQNLISKICLAALAASSLLLVALPVQIQAAPGDLDLTFGTAGYTQSDFFGNGSGANGVVLQLDGRIVVAGSAAFGTDASAIDFALARYLPDGSSDSSFGAGGEVTTDFEGNADVASAVALQADGKIVAAGRSQNATGIDFALARYNTDGSLDTTFGPDENGKVRTVFPSGISRIYAIAIDGDQKIVVAGRAAGANVYDFALARYNTDGSLDATFGSNGTVTNDFSSGETAYALLIQPDQKILAAGSDGSFLLARYHPDGSLDTTFGPDGTGNVRTIFLDNFSLVFSIALQADGALVAAGTVFTDISGIDSSFALARYLPDGDLDLSFGSGGQVTTDFSSGGDGAKGVVVQTDGSIIAGGYGGSDGSDFTLARYLSEGSLDPTFGVGGKVTTDFGGSDFIQAIALQADGKLVAAGGGDPNQDVIVARYLTDGAATRAQPLNISTRADVGTNESVLIGGFIITGSDPKRVILRAIGPSLPLAGVLADPTCELHESDGTVVTNDNWRDTQEEEISETGLAPTNDLESAIVATLDPGSYTVIVTGQDGGRGVALVEAYDLDPAANSQLANISTRGSVGTGDNVMIGGFIIGGASQSSTVVLRGIGPSLGANGVTDPLPDPTLDLYDGEGTLLVSNDDWKDAQEAEIKDSGLAPGDDKEAAILMDLGPGSYTVILRGKNGATGIGLVEAYNLP